MECIPIGLIVSVVPLRNSTANSKALIRGRKECCAPSNQRLSLRTGESIYSLQALAIEGLEVGTDLLSWLPILVCGVQRGNRLGILLALDVLGSCKNNVDDAINLRVLERLEQLTDLVYGLDIARFLFYLYKPNESVNADEPHFPGIS